MAVYFLTGVGLIIFTVVYNVAILVGAHALAAGIDASFSRQSKERRRALFVAMLVAIHAVLKSLITIATGNIPLWGATFQLELVLSVLVSVVIYWAWLPLRYLWRLKLSSS